MNEIDSQFPQTSTPNSPMALVSLVAGILGVSIFPFLGSIIALVTGFIAQKEIRESGGSLAGGGLATAGIVLGALGILLGIFGFFIVGAAILVPLCLLLSFSTIEFQSFIQPLLFAI
jgi:hypothetical protein